MALPVSPARPSASVANLFISRQRLSWQMAALLLSLASAPVMAQNVGIGTPSPAAKLDVAGDLALRRGTDIALVAGMNTDVVIGASSLFRLTGASSAFTVTGFSGGQDGKWLTLVNATTQTLTLKHEDATSSAANRLRTSTATDLTVPAGAAVSLVYNAADQRWQVTAAPSGATSSSGWSLTGNTGVDPASQFIGTTDAQDLFFRTNNNERMRLTQNGSLWLVNPQFNTLVGVQAGQANTTGSNNVFVGNEAGYSNNADNNSFIGYQAGYSNTTGTFNSFLGLNAGRSNTLGAHNSFLGANTGVFNTIGTANSFVGSHAGYGNEQGSNNSFVGNYTGFKNRNGNNNSFLGSYAGNNNFNGSNNSFIGVFAGSRNTDGENNSFMGYQAGNRNTTGNNNVFVGNEAGSRNVVGNENSFLGTQAGFFNTGNNNSFMGYQAGYLNTSGGANSFIGYKAGQANTTGNNNVFVGNAAGYNNNAENNSFIGYQAGYANTNGAANSFFGLNAGKNNTLGNFNCFLGASSGFFNTEGINNIFIGYNTGNSNETGSYNTIIGNNANVGGTSLTNAAAIGYRAQVTQDNSLVLGSINGVNFANASTNVGIGTTAPSQRLHVVGNILYTGTSSQASDQRYKKDITRLSNSLEKVMQLRGVSYHWRKDAFPQLNFDDRTQLGFIAQEIKEVLPEAVTQDKDGYYSVAYTQVIPVLVEALKELKAENDQLREGQASLENKLRAEIQQARQGQEGIEKRLQQLEELLLKAALPSSAPASTEVTAGQK